jgi:hypothetical protein
VRRVLVPGELRVRVDVSAKGGDVVHGRRVYRISGSG